MFDREEAKIGDKLRLNKPHPSVDPRDSLEEGQIVTYAGPCTSSNVDVTILNDPTGRLIHNVSVTDLDPAPTEPLPEWEAELMELLEPVPTPPPPVQATPQELAEILTSAQERCAILEERISNLNDDVARERQRANTAELHHAEDMEKISERLGELADDQGWCTEFDETLEDFSEGLHGTLTSRYKYFDVEVTFRQTITVRARNDDEAIDEAREDDSYGNVGSYEESTIEAEES